MKPLRINLAERIGWSNTKTPLTSLRNKSMTY